MNTIRLTVTANLKKEIDYLRMMEYPTLTYAEIVKAAVGAQAVKSRKAAKGVVEYDDSDPSPEELMFNAAKSFELEDGNVDEEQFWNEAKLKPIKLKNYV